MRLPLRRHEVVPLPLPHLIVPSACRPASAHILQGWGIRRSRCPYRLLSSWSDFLATSLSVSLLLITWVLSFGHSWWSAAYSLMQNFSIWLEFSICVGMRPKQFLSGAAIMWKEFIEALIEIEISSSMCHCIDWDFIPLMGPWEYTLPCHSWVLSQSGVIFWNKRISCCDL